MNSKRQMSKPLYLMAVPSYFTKMEGPWGGGGEEDSLIQSLVRCWDLSRHLFRFVGLYWGSKGMMNGSHKLAEEFRWCFSNNHEIVMLLSSTWVLLWKPRACRHPNRGRWSPCLLGDTSLWHNCSSQAFMHVHIRVPSTTSLPSYLKSSCKPRAYQVCSLTDPSRWVSESRSWLNHFAWERTH